MANANTILKLTVDRVLIFYDLPQLFIAKDQLGGKYVCLNVDTETDYARYFSIPVSINKLNDLILSNIDLRTAFQSSENGVWYFVTFDENEEFITEAVNFDEVPDVLLPEPDFFFPQVEEANQTIIKEATDKGNAIVHLSFVDSHNSNSMDIDLLGDLMKLFQNMVKYAHKKWTAAIKNRPDLERADNYLLRAFAVSEGSFNIHLQSTAPTDLFGNSNIEAALIKIDEIISDVNDGNLLDKIRQNKGHTIGAYKKILDNIIKHNLNLSYKWTSPGSTEVHVKKINKRYAESVIDILNSREDLGTEIKEFIGVVKEADVDNGKWRILNQDDNVQYSGKAEVVSLAGITLDDVVYKFVCEEVVEMIKVTEKEKSTYFLKEFSVVE